MQHQPKTRGVDGAPYKEGNGTMEEWSSYVNDYSPENHHVRHFSSHRVGNDLRAGAPESAHREEGGPHILPQAELSGLHQIGYRDVFRPNSTRIYLYTRRALRS